MPNIRLTAFWTVSRFIPHGYSHCWLILDMEQKSVMRRSALCGIQGKPSNKFKDVGRCPNCDSRFADLLQVSMDSNPLGVFMGNFTPGQQIA